MLNCKNFQRIEELSGKDALTTDEQNELARLLLFMVGYGKGRIERLEHALTGIRAHAIAEGTPGAKLIKVICDTALAE